MSKYSIAAMNKLVASDTSNYYNPNDSQVGQGITLNSDLISNVANSLWYKTSASIKYLQEFGGQLWMPEKQYQVGSIVWVNCVVNGNNTLIPLKCTANSSGRQYCIERPIIDSLTTQDSGYCYFNGNTINTTYWNSVLIDTNVEQSLTVATSSASGTGNSSFKFVKLIDFNQIRGWAEGDFVLKISNGSDRMMATVHVHSYGNTGIEVIIKDVMYSGTFRVDGAGNFLYVGYMGCVLSVDADKCLYLNLNRIHYLSSSSYNISIELSSGNIPLTLFETTKSTQWYGNEANVIVPFIQGASNTFTGCGAISYYYSELSTEMAFRSGLLSLKYNNLNPNSFLYPSVKKIVGSASIPNIEQRYLVQDSNVYGSNKNIEPELPNITGQFNYFYNPQSGRNQFPFVDRACVDNQPLDDHYFAKGLPNGGGQYGYEGCIDIVYWTNRNHGHIYNREQYPYGTGQYELRWDRRYSEFSVPALRIDASLCNPIYKVGGEVKPSSRVVYAYLKVW